MLITMKCRGMKCDVTVNFYGTNNNYIRVYYACSNGVPGHALYHIEKLLILSKLLLELADVESRLKV